MRRSGDRLTAQEQRFVTLVVEEGHSYVSAFRLAYPPRNGPRSAGGERVQAKLVARRPLVQQRMEQLREELLASDPIEMRRRALAVLGNILAKRQDPRYRRTALDVLRYLDEQERAASRAEWQEYEALTARIAALDAAEFGTKRRATTSSPRRTAIAAPAKPASPGGVDEQPEPQRPPAPEDAQVAERRRAELVQVVADRQRMSQSEDARGLALPKQPSRVHDPQHAAHDTPIADQGSHAVRKPGCFGKPVWMRAPGAR